MWLALVLIAGIAQDDAVKEIQKKRQALGEKATAGDLKTLALEAADLGFPGLDLATNLTIEALELDQQSSGVLDSLMDKMRAMAKQDKADTKRLANSVFQVLKHTESIGPAHPLGDLLAEWGDKSYIPGACKELDENKHYGAKKGLAVFLNKHNDRRVVEHFVDRLADEKEQSWVKTFSRSGLAAIHDPAAVPIYIYLLQTRDKLPDDARSSLLKALPDVVMNKNPQGLSRGDAMKYWDDAAGKFKPDAKSFEEWRAWLNQAISQIVSEPKAPDPEIDKKVAAWVVQLGDDRQEVREAATDELVRLGDAAKARVLAAMQDDDPEVRARAVRIVASWEHLESVQGFVERHQLRKNMAFLVELLADPSKETRVKVFDRIRKIDSKFDFDPDASAEKRAQIIHEWRERDLK